MARKLNLLTRTVDFLQHKLQGGAKSKFRFYNPVPAGSSCSDLFIWRVDNNWDTDFALTNISSLCFPEDPQDEEVTAVFFDAKGNQISEYKTYIQPFQQSPLDVREHVSGRTNDCCGTFAVFHTPTHSNLFKKTGTCLSERGYVSYRRAGDLIKSYCHGNTYVLSKTPDASDPIQFTRPNSWRKHQYNLQIAIDDAETSELFIANPTARRETIVFHQHRTSGIVEKSTIKLAPLETHILKPVKETHRISTRSNIFMLRPLVFKTYTNGFDAFHG